MEDGLLVALSTPGAEGSPRDHRASRDQDFSRTTDLETAKRRLTVEALKTDRLFNEARRTLAALAFNAVRQDAADRRQRPRTEDELDAESLTVGSRPPM